MIGSLGKSEIRSRLRQSIDSLVITDAVISVRVFVESNVDLGSFWRGMKGMEGMTLQREENVPSNRVLGGIHRELPHPPSMLH